MKTCVLERSEVAAFFERVLKGHEVVAPVEKEEGFYVFAPVRKAEEVVLDYVTTLLPPKKAFFPQRQTLFRFRLGGDLPEMEPVIDGRPLALAGVHPCDLAGIRMLDWVFARDHPDEHYLAKRRATTIIGVDCHPDEHCFCAAVGTAAPGEGFDLFLTPVEEGYLVSVGTAKGGALLEACAEARGATPADLAAAGQWQREKREKVSRGFETEIYNLPLAFQRGVGSPVWEKVAGPCLSCGTCNLVCPSCFCFDVEDVMDLDGAGGARERVWDGCQLSEFARVAGGGNFRGKVSQRLRHRFYRKYEYLMTLYGAAFCTGCGRCGRSCPVDINVVDTINALVMDDQKEGEAHVSIA